MALMMLKIAEFAPTPRAMVSDAASVKPRARMRRLSAYRRSKFTLGLQLSVIPSRQARDDGGVGLPCPSPYVRDLRNSSVLRHPRCREIHQGTTGCAPVGGNTCNSIPDACAPDRYTRCVAFL